MDCSYITPLMSKNSIKNVLENLFLMFGRGKTQNRAKTHRPSMSAFSAIFVLKENGTQSHSAKFLNWGDHVNAVPDLAVSPPPPPLATLRIKKHNLQILAITWILKMKNLILWWRWNSFYTFSFIGAEQEPRIDDLIFVWLRTFS